MKIVNIFLIILLFFSCENKNAEPKIEVQILRKEKKGNLRNEELIGGWGLNVVKWSSGVSDLCNNCPKVYFKSENIGKLTMANGTPLYFKWELENNFLYFSVNSVKNFLFNFNKYEVQLEELGDFIELSMEDSVGNIYIFNQIEKYPNK
jgi:hypothetical protein